MESSKKKVVENVVGGRSRGAGGVLVGWRGGGGQLQTTKRPSCVPDHISTDDSVTTFVMDPPVPNVNLPRVSTIFSRLLLVEGRTHCRG